MTTDTLTHDDAAPSRVLHYSLWAAQVLIGLAFLMGGVLKATTPLAELALKMPWVTAIPGALTRFIGISEIAGGLGLILPALTRIKPVLTAFAGVGLAIIMVLAALLHVQRGELAALPINFVLGALSTFIAWGRFRGAPIPARS